MTLPGWVQTASVRARGPGLATQVDRGYMLNCSSLVPSGGRFGADSERVSVVTAHWVYAGVKHETREMQRVGLGS